MLAPHGILFLLGKQKCWSLWHCPVGRKPPSGFGLSATLGVGKDFDFFPPVFKAEFLEANMPGVITTQELNLCHLVLW